MTVNYNQLVSSANSFWGISRILLRWKGSIWKSVCIDFVIWSILYFSISILLRIWILDIKSNQINTTTGEFKTISDDLARIQLQLDSGLKQIPLIFMLGFFVSIIVNRWSKLFDNIGFIENLAFMVNAMLKGSGDECRLMRRSIIRYCVVSQILTLRDISLRVRRRFPNLDTIVKAGFLTESELSMLDEIDSPYNRYWAPINWAISICNKADDLKYISAANSYNALIQEINKFRVCLKTVYNFDLMPVPLIFPQVVFLAVRTYYGICLFTRQFIQPPLNAKEYETWIDYYVPIMTMLEFIFMIGWVKVGEELLNPLGEDDDDIETNFLIDRNIALGMSIVDNYGVNPTLIRDRFTYGGFAPMYSQETKDKVGGLVGSVAMVALADSNEDVPMVKINLRHSIGYLPASERPKRRVVDNRTSSFMHQHRAFTGHLPIKLKSRPDANSSSNYRDNRGFSAADENSNNKTCHHRKLPELIEDCGEDERNTVSSSSQSIRSSTSSTSTSVFTAINPKRGEQSPPIRINLSGCDDPHN